MSLLFALHSLCASLTPRPAPTTLRVCDKFTGGSLSFLSSSSKKKKKKKKKKKEKRGKDLEGDEGQGASSLDDVFDEFEDMTESERRAAKRKREREMKDLEIVAKKSHRERVEDFNTKLSTLTEHNDIPRISAAGNG